MTRIPGVVKLRKRADQCRHLASGALHPRAREKLLKIAEYYELLASEAPRLRRRMTAARDRFPTEQTTSTEAS